MTSLTGIGPKLAEILQRLLVGADGPEARVVDLLFHLPVGVVDRSRQPGIAEAAQGSIVTLKVRVDRHAKAPRNNPRIPYRVFARDDTGEIALTFFHARADWLEKTLPVGATVYVSGKMDWFNGRPTMVHPDHIVSEAELAELPLIEPAVSDDGGALAQGAGARHRRWARPRPGPDGVARPRARPAKRVARVRTGAAARPSTGGRGPTSSRRRRTARASPTTSCWRASWRWR